MELIDSKSILAKLMATENLTVEQRNVPTAFFDVENRVLTVPVLDNKISSQLYDLFMGHEVGHALYTPAVELKENLVAGVDSSIINVVEDSRIERKVKQKYPGLSKSFIKGYSELLERDFFETTGKDLNKLNFIDRVNLHTKGGPAQGIKFNGVEQYLLDKVENTQTFSDVIEVCKEIVEYMKREQEEKEKKKKKGQQKQNSDDDGQDNQEKEDSESSNSKGGDKKDESEEKSRQNSEKDDSKDEKSDKNEDTPKSENNTEKGFDKKGSQEELKSHTDEAFRKNESKLFDRKARDYAYANIPEFDVEKTIFDYKEFYSNYKKGSPDGLQYFSSKKDFDKIRTESAKVVSYLVKEFELRKNADQMKKASMAKTGDLNMSKIFSYQFNDDIFKKISVVPNGKSHGLVMILDWSGSMGNHIANTMKQLFNLVLFCKKVNIPYEVYAFTADTLPEHIFRFEPKVGDLALHHFAMVNILSSRMSPTDFMYAGSVLCSLANIGRSEGQFSPYWTCLSSTPLNQAIICAMKLVPEFQKKNRLQIVNTVFLTDGESDCIEGIHYEERNVVTDKKWINSKALYGVDTLVIRDPKTKHQETVKECFHGSNVTTGLVKMLKTLTNCNIIGFYVLAGSEFNRKIIRFHKSLSNDVYNKLTADFRKDNYSVVTSAGFDEYYLLRSQGMAIDDDAEFEVKENATTRGIVSAFTKYTGNRLNNRVVLNRFIKLIA
jgi:hypothetical protein